MGKEKTEYVENPRQKAFSFVSNSGTHNLKVDKWLDAGRPGNSKKSEPVQATVNPELHPSESEWATNAKKGITGRVVETGESFTVREDWDFENGNNGKGYHVNATLGDEKKAFCKKGHSSEEEYRDRTKMLGERYHHDGPEEAAEWFQGKGSFAL